MKSVAYYTSSNPDLCTPEELKNYLRRSIPDYLIPDSIFMVKSFSFKENGSIDIDKLLESESKLIISRQTGNERDGIEQKLLDIWKKVFKNNSISINDNFFELGGHSMLAGQIYSEIEKVIGKVIPLSTLFKSPTVAQLASDLQENNSIEVWSYLTPIQPRGNLNPLFLIPSTNGNIQIYRECAKYMGNELPVYVLKSVEVGENSGDLVKFEDIAAKYVKEIRAFQPHGPYYIGGYCVGGTLALEVAQQIIKHGEKINYLAMIENYNFHSLQNPEQSEPESYHKFLDMYFNNIDIFLSQNDKKLKFIHKKNSKNGREYQFLFKRKFSIFDLKSGTKQNTEFNNEITRKAYIKALFAYKPKSYPGSINLFISNNNPNNFTNFHCGWDSIAEKGVSVQNIEFLPVNSRSEPYLKDLAVKLKLSMTLST
jgi:acyl carrier protein